MLLPAKMRTLGQLPISHLQGCFFFSQALCFQGSLLLLHLSLQFIFPVAADSLTDSRSAGVSASVSWRQWQRMQVITIPSQGLLLCLQSLCGWFQGRLTPSCTSTLREPLHKGDTFCNLLLRCFYTFVDRKAGKKLHFYAALSKSADNFHWFRNRLGQNRDRCREER